MRDALMMIKQRVSCLGDNIVSKLHYKICLTYIINVLDSCMVIIDKLVLYCNNYSNELYDRRISYI